MRNIFFIIGFISTILFKSCTNEKQYNLRIIDYSNNAILDSLIKETPMSNDTIFLGIRMGMTKAEYKEHINKLKKEGKTITFSKSNVFSTIAGRFDVGEGYTFRTSITSSNNKVGTGDYFLEPIYNKDGLLNQLNIVDIEKWNNDYDNPQWLKNKIKEGANDNIDEKLFNILDEEGIVSKYDLIGKKGNVVIDDTGFTIRYIDLKTIYQNLLLKRLQKEVIEDNNKDIKF